MFAEVVPESGAEEVGAEVDLLADEEGEGAVQVALGADAFWLGSARWR